MLSPNRRRLGGFVIAVALFPGGVSAQTVAHSFEELQRMLKVRQTVVVTDESVRNSRGGSISCRRPRLQLTDRPWPTQPSERSGFRMLCGTGCSLVQPSGPGSRCGTT